MSREESALHYRLLFPYTANARYQKFNTNIFPSARIPCHYLEDDTLEDGSQPGRVVAGLGLPRRNDQGVETLDGCMVNLVNLKVSDSVTLFLTMLPIIFISQTT